MKGIPLNKITYCKKCGIKFIKHNNRHKYCPACNKIINNKRAKQWQKTHKEQAYKTAKAWRQNNPDKMKDKDLKRVGSSLKEYNKMLEKQNYCCAICGKHYSNFKRALCVDHDHQTGRIRGLLCIACNSKVAWLENYKSKINKLLTE